MTKRMLIDSTNKEETRVAVVDGVKLEDFEVETSTRKQLKGNVYLAKVIRIEPSLQAAFVDYGGNRHGFLPFNEIHPDYYQIPEDEKASLLEELEAEEEKYLSNNNYDKLDDSEDEKNKDIIESQGEDAPDEDALDRSALRGRLSVLRRRFKIHEVIKRKQIILVQITKEERGNKGAAMTTYLSLAGRYCVLMPNTNKGGGVSRKITNPQDRRKLKTILRGLPTTSGMSVIVRTAGKERTKAEITRDFNYLMRTWEKLRNTALDSYSPSLVHEEANLIKRSIRDVYSRDISEILVEGEDAYRTAKDFMKLLTPSHAKKVQPYKDEKIPLFFRYQVEQEIDVLHSSVVQLESGGYLVINPTEALVAIDVNSGRATKEKNIEETALNTNLEAAKEVARQLKLRNLAGLIVIDFIDMEEASNNHAVERCMKEALKKDRSRIQMSRISGFGLMEISRQRLHSSFLEMSYTTCPHCKGKGLVRSTESAACFYLRIIEEEGVKQRSQILTVTVPTETAIYILNKKRKALASIEKRYGMQVFVRGDEDLIYCADYRIDRVKLDEKDKEVLENKEKAFEKQEEKSEKTFDDKKEESDQEKDRKNNRRGTRGNGRRQRKNKDKNNDNRNNNNKNYKKDNKQNKNEKPSSSKPEKEENQKNQIIEENKSSKKEESNKNNSKDENKSSDNNKFSDNSKNKDKKNFKKRNFKKRGYPLRRSRNKDRRYNNKRNDWNNDKKNENKEDKSNNKDVAKNTFDKNQKETKPHQESKKPQESKKEVEANEKKQVKKKWWKRLIE